MPFRGPESCQCTVSQRLGRLLNKFLRLTPVPHVNHSEMPWVACTLKAYEIRVLRSKFSACKSFRPVKTPRKHKQLGHGLIFNSNPSLIVTKLKVFTKHDYS